jgi:hypothetical protein
LALASSALLYEDMVGRAGAGAYYAGESGREAARAPAGGGPEIELPDSPRPSLTVAVSYRKLLEVTHFHLFTAPVFLLIITHLFMQTGLTPRAKTGWIVGGWASAFLHLAAPWIVRYGGGSCAPLYGLYGALLGVTATVLTAYPVWAMWLGRAREDG